MTEKQNTTPPFLPEQQKTPTEETPALTIDTKPIPPFISETKQHPHNVLKAIVNNKPLTSEELAQKKITVNKIINKITSI